MKPLPHGVPLQGSYNAVIESPEYRDMATFSSRFLASNHRVLRDYVRQWVDDPLRCWNRKWEYPYVLGQMRPGLDVLDAGSGVTFLPFYIGRRFEGTSVTCCDIDDWGAMFRALGGGSVRFKVGDIRELPFEDMSFDLVCCVSVLEHVRGYRKSLAELARVLRPGGRLVVTFDINLDETRDIRPSALLAFLGSFADCFDESPTVTLAADMVTTYTVPSQGLPWRGPPALHRLKACVANRRVVPWPPLSTVCCLTVTRRGS